VDLSVRHASEERIPDMDRADEPTREFIDELKQAETSDTTYLEQVGKIRKASLPKTNFKP
jgi:hypothetical protein